MNPAAPVTTYRMRGGYSPLPREPVEPRVADEVEPLTVGDDRRVLAVRERPDELPVERVQRVGAALQRREVDDPVHDRRRTGDRAVRGERPPHRAGGCVEGVEVLVVRA